MEIRRTPFRRTAFSLLSTRVYNWIAVVIITPPCPTVSTTKLSTIGGRLSRLNCTCNSRKPKFPSKTVLTSTRNPNDSYILSGRWRRNEPSTPGKVRRKYSRSCLPKITKITVVRWIFVLERYDLHLFVTRVDFKVKKKKIRFSYPRPARIRR